MIIYVYKYKHNQYVKRSKTRFCASAPTQTGRPYLDMRGQASYQFGSTLILIWGVTTKNDNDM